MFLFLRGISAKTNLNAVTKGAQYAAEQIGYGKLFKPTQSEQYVAKKPVNCGIDFSKEAFERLLKTSHTPENKPGC